MNNYRLYRIDGAGRISAAEWLEAPDDRSAEEQAARLCENGGVAELWARDRLIARVEAQNGAQNGALGSAQSGA